MTEIGFDSEKINSIFRGKYSDKDLSYIDKLFCDKSRETELRQLLRKQWYELFQEEIEEEKNLDHILYRIHYGINTNSQVLKRKNYLCNLVKWTSRIAAILILPLAFYSGIHSFNTSKSDNLAWVEIKASAWTRAQFSLPDGTTGWLNSNSSIKYNGAFGKNRQVKLNGEAFFDVVRNEKRPFEVIADDIVITVLGTKFNVASYDNENLVEVVLEEGKIVLEDKGSMKSYTMKSKDYLAFNKTNLEFKIDVVQPEKYISWKEGKLVFRNDPLDVVARRLERWYNIEVEVRGVIPADPVLWATFINENYEDVLKLIQLSLNVSYEIIQPKIETDGTFSKPKILLTSNAN